MSTADSEVGLKTSRIAAMVTALGVVLGFAGCSWIATRPPMEADVAYVLGRIEDNANRLRDFEGQAEVYVWWQGTYQRVSMLVLFKRPDLLKVEVYGLLGMSLLKMSIRGESLIVYAPMANRFIEEPVEGGLLQMITGFDLRSEDLRDVLLGTVHLKRTDLEQVAAFERGEDTYRIVVEKAGRIHWLAVDDRRWTVVEDEVFNAHGDPMGKRSMRHFGHIQGVALPRSIELVRNGDRVQIEFTSQRVNLGLSDARFEIPRPRPGGEG